MPDRKAPHLGCASRRRRTPPPASVFGRGGRRAVRRWRLIAGLVLIAACPASGRLPPEGVGPDSLKRAFLTLAQEKAALERENRTMRLELELVGQDSAYAILDLKARQLRFKLQGVEVRAYDLLDLTVEGDLSAWPDSIRSAAGPFSVTEKEDLGPPPVPRKPKPRNPLDLLPPDPVDSTACYYNLCFGDSLVLRVVPGDSVQAQGAWTSRVSKQALKAFQAVRRQIAVALGWEAEDRRVRIVFRLPFDQAQAVFRSARVGLQAILIP